MKRILILFLIIALSLSGCSQTSNRPDHPMKQWAEQANLTAEETPEELYAAALKENTLIVYSTSTRMMDVAESFEAHYPGLTVKVEDIREGEMYDMLRKNFDNGEYICDMVCSADGRGIMTNEFLPEGIVYKYTPYDIGDKILPGYDEDLLMLAKEAIVLSYNEEYYPSQPVSNWWELTEEQWRGKIYMPNPTRSTTTFVFMSMFIQNSPAMLAAYEDRYGEKLRVSDDETAGHVFIRQLIENDTVIVNSSDEVSEAIAQPGVPGENLGIMITSKLRLRSIGYPLAVVRGNEPFDGLCSPIILMMAGGARNVSTAKLFTRWILGEADGQGEGYKPYLQSGAWSLRSDVDNESEIPMEGLDLLEMDRVYLYEHKDEILAFWESLIQARQ